MALRTANNQSMSAITELPSGVSAKSLILISTTTASSSSTISITSGIDSTYKEYIIKMYDVHPQTDVQDFNFNLSVDSGSNYNVSKTTSFITSYNHESNGEEGLVYEAGKDLANGTGVQCIKNVVDNNNDDCCVAIMHLFDPSNTTFVKHFLITSQATASNEYSGNHFVAGYANTTSAVNAIQFSFASGNIDAGTFKLYGVL
jgi:hypothetical protein